MLLSRVTLAEAMPVSKRSTNSGSSKSKSRPCGTIPHLRDDRLKLVDTGESSTFCQIGQDATPDGDDSRDAADDMSLALQAPESLTEIGRKSPLIQHIEDIGALSETPHDTDSGVAKPRLWNNFIEDSRELLRLRIRADESRRKAKDLRRKFLEKMGHFWDTAHRSSAVAQLTDADRESIEYAKQKAEEADQQLEAEDQAIIVVEAKVSSSFPHVENFEPNQIMQIVIEMQDDGSSDGSTRCDSIHLSDRSASAQRVDEIFQKIDLIEEILGERKEELIQARREGWHPPGAIESLERSIGELGNKLTIYHIELELRRRGARPDSPFVESSGSARVAGEQQRSESLHPVSLSQ